MKLLAFLLILAVAESKDEHNFRYTNGIINIGKDSYSKGEGIAWLWDQVVVYYGMEMSSMIPYMMLGIRVADYSMGDKIDVTMKCTEGTWSSITFMNLEGAIRISGNYPKIDFKFYCYCAQHKINWTLSATGVEVDNPYYYGREAGYKAKDLINYPIATFPGASVIQYSIWGYPYFGMDCLSFFYKCNEIDTGKPGAVITDFRYCGMLDNEGSRFIHPNPDKRVITQTSIAMARQFFPNGYTLLDCTGAVI